MFKRPFPTCAALCILAGTQDESVGLTAVLWMSEVGGAFGVTSPSYKFLLWELIASWLRNALKSPNSFSKAHFTADLIQHDVCGIINGFTQACISQTALYFYILVGIKFLLVAKCACCSACCLLLSASGSGRNLHRRLSTPSIQVNHARGFILLSSPDSSISLILPSQHFLVPLSASPSPCSMLTAHQHHFKQSHFEPFRRRGTRSSEQEMI